MSLAQLRKSLSSPDANDRAAALEAVRDTDYDAEALPLLRRALADKSVLPVIAAAACIARLGPAALESPAADRPVKVEGGEVDLVSQLVLAGGKVWAYSGGYPNAYSACLEALVAIGADEDTIVEFVHDHIGLSNADDFLDSARALRRLDTPDARKLLARAVTFWRPVLNKGQSKQLDAVLAKKT
jgi:hypothetical protein